MTNSKSTPTEALLNQLRQRDSQGAASHIRDGHLSDIAAEIDIRVPNGTEQAKINALLEIRDRDTEAKRFRPYVIRPPGFLKWTAAEKLEWHNTGVPPAPAPTPPARVLPYPHPRPGSRGPKK